MSSGERAPTAEGESSAVAPAAAPNLTPPPGNPRFPLLDSMRALAALCVFAGHTVTGTYTLAQHPQLFVWAVLLAHEGVAIFFLLSGFLLYRPFLTARAKGREFSLLDYARRRVLRIVPAYWVALTLFLLLGFVGGVNGRNWWIFYGFAQSYSFNTVGNGIGVAWTLCIEVSFYAALPLFALLAGRLSGARRSPRADVALLVVLALASLAFRAQYTSLFDLGTISTLPGTFLWFALGMGLAVTTVTERCVAAFSRLTRAVRHWATLSWCLALLAFWLLHEVPSIRGLSRPASAAATYTLYGLPALFLLLPATFEQADGGRVRRFLRLPALRWIGLVSYAFYLYHTIVIAQLDKFAIEHGLTARYVPVAVAALAISLACAAASFYLLECPLMWIGSRRAAEPASRRL